MNWYIFYTPRGWAAIRSEKKTLFAMVLPHPTPKNLSSLYKLNRVLYPVYYISFPLVDKFRSYFNGHIINDWEVELGLFLLKPSPDIRSDFTFYQQTGSICPQVLQLVVLTFLLAKDMQNH